MRMPSNTSGSSSTTSTRSPCSATLVAACAVALAPDPAEHDLVALIYTDGLELHDPSAFTDVRDRHARGDFVAGKHGRDELERLAEIDAALARKFIGKDR